MYKSFYTCQALGSGSGIVTVSVLLGRDAASLGDRYGTFPVSVLVFKGRRLLEFSVLEDVTCTLARNVRHQSPCDVASHPGRVGTTY